MYRRFADGWRPLNQMRRRQPGERTNLRRVAIIGGGISGLAAAWGLHHHPDRFDFRLYEARDRVGGNAVLPFALSAALIASVYLGDSFSFVLYAMASQPALYEKIRIEADALFANGDPGREAFRPRSIDVTHRFLMECLRMYPIVPMSVRNVMNTCVVEDYERPVGSRVYIAQTAAHYMNDVFPDPFTFDIDRYLPPRDEHRGAGYAPYGLGTHRWLGTGWIELQLAVNVLMIAHYFTIEVSPANVNLVFSPLPSTKPSKKLKFHIAE